MLFALFYERQESKAIISMSVYYMADGHYQTPFADMAASLQVGPGFLEWQLLSRQQKSVPLEKMAALVSGLCGILPYQTPL